MIFYNEMSSLKLMSNFILPMLIFTTRSCKGDYEMQEMREGDCFQKFSEYSLVPGIRSTIPVGGRL